MRLDWAYLSVHMYTIIHEKLTRITSTQLDLLWFQFDESIDSDNGNNIKRKITQYTNTYST